MSDLACLDCFNEGADTEIERLQKKVDLYEHALDIALGEIWSDPAAQKQRCLDMAGKGIKKQYIQSKL